MSEIANASINSFAPAAQQTEVSPEEPVFVTIPATALRDLLGAIQGLKDEVQDLKVTVTHLEAKVSDLEATQDTLGENDLNQLRLIADLRKGHEPQPLQKDRGEILRALLAANGGKMLAKDARQKMRLEKSTFSVLIDSLKDYIDSKPLHSDRRQLVLFIK